MAFGTIANDSSSHPSIHLTESMRFMFTRMHTHILHCCMPTQQRSFGWSDIPLYQGTVRTHTRSSSLNHRHHYWIALDNWSSCGIAHTHPDAAHESKSTHLMPMGIYGELSSCQNPQHDPEYSSLFTTAAWRGTYISFRNWLLSQLSHFSDRTHACQAPVMNDRCITSG